MEVIKSCEISFRRGDNGGSEIQNKTLVDQIDHFNFILEIINMHIYLYYHIVSTSGMSQYSTTKLCGVPS